MHTYSLYFTSPRGRYDHETNVHFYPRCEVFFMFLLLKVMVRVHVNHCDEISLNLAGLIRDLRAAVSCFFFFFFSLNTYYKDRADSFMHQQVK